MAPDPTEETIPEDDTPTETYRVTSRNCALGPFGSIVSAGQLEGLHVESLIGAGHLTPTTSTPDTDPDGAAADPDPAAPNEGS